MTIEEIQIAILEAIARRDELVREAQGLYISASEAEHSYRMAQARAYIKVEGKNADERRSQVDLIVDREMAEKDKISAFQTLLRLRMTELDALRFGQHNQA